MVEPAGVAAIGKFSMLRSTLVPDPNPTCNWPDGSGLESQYFVDGEPDVIVDHPELFAEMDEVSGCTIAVPEWASAGPAQTLMTAIPAVASTASARRERNDMKTLP
jgi:hypothetical protein